MLLHLSNARSKVAHAPFSVISVMQMEVTGGWESGLKSSDMKEGGGGGSEEGVREDMRGLCGRTMTAARCR